MGSEQVVWGTDSVWYGSPQWQIEALRRLEIPEDMMKKQGWKTQLGAGNGAAKNNILGLNSARVYRLNPQKIAEGVRPWENDMLAKIKGEYLANGGDTGRSNMAYGYVAKKDAA